MISYSQPAGQQLTVDDLPVVREELNTVSAKWYDIGLQLGVNVGRLEEIKEYGASERLRETLMTWLKTNPLPPTWTMIVIALKSDTVGEVRLAADLEHKYCTAQDTSTTATHHPAPPVPAVPPSQVSTLVPPLPQSTVVPLTWSPVFASPYPVPPLPYPSHFPPWSAPYYHPPSTSYPVSTPSLPPPTNYPVSTPSLPPPTSYPVSTPSLPLPTSYPLSTPPPSGAASTAVPPSTRPASSELPQVTPGHTSLVPAQPTIPQLPLSDAVQTVTVPQYPVQPAVAAGMLISCFCRLHKT